MCDCYSMICKCRKFYVPIHITDFAYPREIIKQAYCPYCNYLGPKADKKEYQTNSDGEFVIDNYLFHCGVTKGDEIETKIKISSKRANGFFALVFDKRHKEYKDASLFLEENVGFNGNPNDVENMLPDCYRYQCMNIEKRNRRDGFLKCLLHVDYCTVYRKEIWKIKRTLKFDCRFGKPQNQNFEVKGNG